MKYKTTYYIIKHNKKEKYLGRDYAEQDITRSTMYNALFNVSLALAERYGTISDAIKDYNTFNCVYENMSIFEVKQITEIKFKKHKIKKVKK